MHTPGNRIIPQNRQADHELAPAMLACEQPFIHPGSGQKGTISSARVMFDQSGEDRDIAYFQEILVVSTGIDESEIYYSTFQAKRMCSSTSYSRPLNEGVTEIFTPNSTPDLIGGFVSSIVYSQNGKILDPEEVAHLRIPFGAPEAPPFK